MSRFALGLIAATLCVTPATTASERLPDTTVSFLRRHCFDCHGNGGEEGGIQLDAVTVDWTDAGTRKKWAKVHKVLATGEMPPQGETAPIDDHRDHFLNWLDRTLVQHDGPGGTVLRRLNRREYGNSVSRLLDSAFTVPTSFPADTDLHGFDNIAESLVLSPPLMLQYFEVAGKVADQLIAPAETARSVQAKTIKVPADAMTLSADAGRLTNTGVCRLFSSRNSMNGSMVWPQRFEALASGVYSVRIDATTFQDSQSQYPLRTEAFTLGLYARDTSGPESRNFSAMRKLGEYEVAAGQQGPQSFQTTVELMQSETIAMRWEDSPMTSSSGRGGFSRESMDFWLSDPRIRAAYNTIGYQRNLSIKDHHTLVFKLAASETLDVDDPDLQDIEHNFSSGDRTVQLWKFALYDMILHGPALDIVSAEIHGPIRLIEDQRTKDRRLRTQTFMGERNGQSDQQYASSILRRFLTAAFRRPCDDALLKNYVSIALSHQRSGQRFEDGIHLAIRTALCSSNFLYRGQRAGRLDEYDLASRLSYFLTCGPPDDELLQLAAAGMLSESSTLETQTRRLLAADTAQQFLESFTGQWLDLDALPDIMPDERLMKWRKEHLSAVTKETQMFVAEILRENHPLETFIDADFTYINRWNAALYEIEGVQDNKMTRFTLPADKRRGGILTHPSVMMATANGVDTQPVLRGVWMLENIFGDPTPEPPDDVPAIEPDTSGARSIRELLDRHKVDPNCASCHRKIDPPGFALENFDPVGRWREHYPVYVNHEGDVVREDGLPVDSVGELTDGTTLADVTDLKQHLVDHLDLFSRCLTSKLLIYATGRLPGYGDQKEINQIVAQNRRDGNGFQDLIIAIVLSDSFRTK